MKTFGRNDIFKHLDCLCSTMLLVLNWDERLFRRVLRRYDHCDVHRNQTTDPNLLLYRIHHECHNGDSPVAQALIRYFSRIHRREVDMLLAIPLDNNGDELLNYTASRFADAPGAIFWAMAADERPEMLSLLSYHAHRLLRYGFQAGKGAVFSVEKQKRENCAVATQLDERNKTIAAFENKISALERENIQLRQQLESRYVRERELRMLRHELKSMTQGVTHAENQIRTQEDDILIAETNNPCRCDYSECLHRRGICPLEKLKIAIIGGMARLENQYKSVFESLGCEKFYFHSGCSNDGGYDRLRETSEAADIIVFITRINSHNAMNIVKGICKKTGKAFLAVRETSPKQISQIVIEEMKKTDQ